MERLPFAFYILTQIAFLFVHYPTTRRAPRIFYFIFLLALLFYSYAQYSLRSPGEDYVLGCTNGITLLTAAHMTFLSPDFPNGFQSNPLTTEPGSTPSQLPFAQKLSWMTELATNMRRIGVTRSGSGAMDGRVVVVDSKRDPANSSARKRFVISRVILSISCLAMFHLTLLYRSRDRSFNPALHQDARDDGRFIRAHPSLLRRSWDVIVWATGTSSEMTFLQATAAALSVGVGASRPEDWPLMFGSPTHAYSVRRFWSKTWHQVLRIPLEQSGAQLARGALKLDKGTAAFTVAQTMTAFFLSALVHTGGDYAIHRSFEKSGPTFQFFLLQPAAILIEEIAIRGARSTVPVRIPNLAWRGVGYLWVVLWFAWCAPPWLDAITSSGGNVRTKLIPLKMLERFF